MEYQQAPAAAKLANGIGGAGGGGGGAGLSGKHVYDGVFGGVLKSGTARVEDYREIFSGSRNCSIPIIDFPEINSSGDARSSKPDYSMIFGGFREADYGVPYEELIAKPNKEKSLSKNARTPAEVRFCPAVPERSSIVEEKKAQSPDVCLQSFDAVKQFNVSYNKSNQGNKNGTDGITHVDRLHSIPAYTCMVDETTPSQMTDTIKPVRAVVNDAHMNININEPMKAGKHLRKVVSGPQPRSAAIDTSTIHVEPQKKSSRNRSFSNDISLDGFEIGLGTFPSRMSPQRPVHNVGNNKGQTMKSVNSKFGVYKSEVSEGAAGSYSPTLSDEEIDANSAAFTSAAALRKAIEEAQVKMKIAKELMEKKRQGFHNRSKSSFNDSLKAERTGSKAAEKANRSKEEAQEMYHKVCTTTKQVFTRLPENNETKVRQINPDIRNVEQSSAIKNAVGETHSTESRWAPVNHILEAENGKATNGFSEPAGACEPKSTALEVKQITNIEEMKPWNNESKEKMAGEENRKNPAESDKKLKAYEEAPKEKIERVLNSVAAAFKWDIFRNFIKSDEDIQSQEENENKTRVAHAHKEADRTPEVPHKPEAQAKSETEEMEKNKDVKELKEGEHQVTIDKIETEAHDQEEVENRSNEVRLRMESKTLLHEIDGHKGKGREDLDGVKYEEKQNDVPKQDDAELSGQADKQEVTVVSSNIDFQEKVESEERLRGNCGTVGNENLEDSKENVDVFNSMTENQTEKTCEELETEKMRTDIHLRADDAKVTQQSFRFQESNLETTNDVYKMNAGKDDEACGDEKFERVQITSGVVVEETDTMMEVTGDSFPEEAGKKTKAVEEAHDLVEEDDLETGDPEQGLIGVDGMQTADVYVVKPDFTVDHRPNGYCVMEYAEVCEQEKCIKEVTSLLDENDQDVSETETGVNDEENESNFASLHEVKQLGMEIESKTLCGPDEQVEESVYELGQNYRDVKEPEVTTNIEDENFFESYSEGKCVNNTIRGQQSQQPYIFEEEGKNIRISLEEIANQSTDKEESHHETLLVEKHDTEDTLRKEIELEEKHHGRREETKLREMEKENEKEKERIAVERAIREARERAFAEARERAERAAAEKTAAEAHQRMMAGAREKLEKACAEANGKSAVEKASMEAKLKAERAAVERATAEARERALERALSEKAALKAQAEKVAAEKFSRGARDAGFKSTDQQYKGPVPASSSRYPSSSNQDDRLDGTNCESVERCKATLEKNQRTAERAAKALAEKNMRDFLAQKEQAERNRLAEILDADVKRWSSGKERNLRALLSTLQYILGPDSGWQPISLTDLISSAAVKKAYRKATLFVHPDKLQQRGASIQQKYTCEKVFDLLKDAWNKFSADER